MAFTSLEQADHEGLRKPSARTYYRIVVGCLVLWGIGFGVGWAANTSPSPSSNTQQSSPSNATISSNATIRSKAKAAATRPLFILYGDSITQLGSYVASLSWAAQLQQTYVRSVDVLNRGLSAYNTKTFLQSAIPTFRDVLASALSPTLIALWLGTNDATLDRPNMIRHVPIDQYQANLVSIVSQFRELAPSAKILVITPGVVDDEACRRAQSSWGWPSDLPLCITNERAALYAEACTNVTRSMGSGGALLNLHTALMAEYPSAVGRAALLGDCLHLSKEGNSAVFEPIHDEIRTLLPATLLDTPQVDSI